MKIFYLFVILLCFVITKTSENQNYLDQQLDNVNTMKQILMQSISHDSDLKRQNINLEVLLTLDNIQSFLQKIRLDDKPKAMNPS